MLSKNLIVPCAIALIAASAPAFAQSTTGGTAGSPNTIGVGASQIDLTCAQLSSVDQAQATNMLYFLSGYDQGRQEAIGGMGGSTNEAVTDAASNSGVGGGSPSGTNTGGAAGASADTAAAAGGAGNTGASGAASTGTSGAAGGATDTAAATTGAAGDVSGNMAGAAETNATGSGAAGSVAAGGVTTMPAFQSIDTAAIMTACQASPNAMVTDVIAAGGAGAGTQ